MTEKLETIPSPQALSQAYPISSIQNQFISETRKKVQHILEGKDDRLLLIVGPCSIHDITAAKDYAVNLSRLIPKVEESFLILMRVYFEKPRTITGWKGMLYDPWLNNTHDMKTGLKWTRQLLLDLADLKIPAASEFLDPATPHYFGDLISWGCIGARTAESQIHRQMASGLQMPISFKNSTQGNVNVAIHGVIAATQAHSFFGINSTGRVMHIQTEGNPLAHITLRGGENDTNYTSDKVKCALSKLKKAKLSQRLLIDCSHGNSQHQHENQYHVFRDVINQVMDGNKGIRGLLVESHLLAGKQSLSYDSKKLQYGVSVTDSCLDWEMTEKMILWAHNALRSQDKKLGSLCCSLENYARVYS